MRVFCMIFTWVAAAILITVGVVGLQYLSVDGPEWLQQHKPGGPGPLGCIGFIWVPVVLLVTTLLSFKIGEREL